MTKIGVGERTWIEARSMQSLSPTTSKILSRTGFNARSLSVGFDASLSSIGVLHETTRRRTLMGHQATVVDQRVTMDTLRLAIVIKYDTLIPVIPVILDERVLLSVLIVLRAVSREVQLHIFAVIVVERM
ncbi:hypothetical protein N7517_001074 [Penicillium concentricum]|uniref:Uncharacterized protein n=1 Tax=Penicillium concentricum TaxID=293559 RepID=A0A9W9SR70_9EURO|nr:uncharacterized protein N7517_001074 [Penicillium concentricum]KAJ5383163.1 hypothetical protein N7517_001074 [Penicillium concentricum]